MEKKSEIPAEIRYIVPLAEWMVDHPFLSSVIIAIEAILLVLTVFFYNFTTTL